MGPARPKALAPLLLVAPAPHRRMRGSRESTLDLSPDTPRQARRFPNPSRSSCYQVVSHRDQTAFTLVRGHSAVESSRPLLAMRGEAFLHVRAAKTQEFQAERRLEGGREHAVPVVEAVFGPADRVLRPLRQIIGDAGCRREHVVIVDADRYQADALSFLAQQGVAGE